MTISEILLLIVKNWQSEKKANRQAALRAIEKYGEEVNDKNIDGFIRHFREDARNENKESDMVQVHHRKRGR